MKTRFSILIISFLLFNSGILLSQVTITDPGFSNQWYLNMTGTDATRADVRILDAWTRTMGNSNQKIADIEDDPSGVPLTSHPDLLNRITTHNGIIIGNHSTYVAGILIANHNGIGIVGINKFASLNSYVYSTFDEWANRILSAVSDGNQIINISQGAPPNQSMPQIATQLMEAHNNNIITIVSAGNSNSAINIPAAFPGVIAIGASTKDNTSATYSNSGPQLKFLAPGGSTLNDPTNIKNLYTTSSNGSYTYASGTSMAAPVVSGAASLLSAYKPDLTNEDVKNLLIYSCDKLEEMQGADFNNKCGYGRINLKKAMQLLESPYTLTHGTATLTKLSDLEKISITENPVLSTGVYFVDAYKLSVDRDDLNYLEAPKAWIPMGYSAARPMNCKEYMNVSTTSTSVHANTYFYYVRYTISNTAVNKWFPYNPSTVYTILGKPNFPINVPQDYSTITLAIANALPGQTVNVSGSQTLNGNITVPGGVTLKFLSGSSLNFGSYGIFGTITLDNGADINGVYFGGGFYHVQTAINNAVSGQTVNLLSRTYNTSISLTSKTNVTISGNGAGNSTINGSVGFNSSQGCTLRNLTVTGNISLNYGNSDNFINYVTVQGNIQPNMGSHSHMTYIDLTSSGNTGIYAGYCNSLIEFSSIKNKSIEGVFATGMDLDIYYSTFCQNGPSSNRLDVYSQGSSPDIYLHTDQFSAPSAGSTILGSYIHYDLWSDCGIFKTVSSADNTASIKELPSLVDRLSDSKKSLGFNEYQKVIENKRNIFYKIKKDNEGSKIDYKQYAKELTGLISDFRAFIQKYPGSITSINSLQEIIDCYRLLQMNKEAKQLLDNLLKSDVFAELNPRIKILSIPLFVDIQDYDGALNIFDEIIKEIPNTSEASFLLYNKAVLIETYKSDKKTAEAIYDQLLKQNPNSIWSSLAAEKLGKTITPKKVVDTKKAEEFSLNNYPNPFNPVTIIKYRIPVNGFVTLKIFDALGREIKTLVNEYKAGGEYSVDFNASGLVSGVYISQLRMNDFVQSKKMMLLK